MNYLRLKKELKKMRNNEAEEQQSLNNEVLKHVIKIKMSKYPFRNQSLRAVNRFFKT